MRSVLLASLTVAAAALLTSGDARAHRGAWVELRGSDDFLYDPDLPLEPLLGLAIRCVDGEPTGDPLLPCTEGASVDVRIFPGQSRIDSNDPRFRGRLTVVGRGRLDPDYAGLVSGFWFLKLSSGDGAFRGLFRGTRAYVSGPPESWRTEVRLVGLGAGSVSGTSVFARETAVTYSPLPLPYEALVAFGRPEVCPNGVCPPEGLFEGRLYGVAGASAVLDGNGSGDGRSRRRGGSAW